MKPPSLLQATSGERATAALVVVLGLAAAFVLFWRHPSALPIPTCPFLAVTDFYCPGCGSLRACHHLAHGRLAEAWGHNPLLLTLAPFLGVWFLGHVVTLVSGWRLELEVHPRVGWAVLAVIVTYWIVRNLPLDALSVLRPPA